MAKCCDEKNSSKSEFFMACEDGAGKNRIRYYAFQKIIGQYRSECNCTASHRDLY